MKKSFFYFIAWVSVIGSANADITSKSYVDSGDDTVMGTIGVYDDNGDWDVTTNEKKTITGAINELNSTIGTIPDGKTVKEVLDTKLDDTFAGEANKAVITNNDGEIITGQIATGMIADNAVTTNQIADTTIVNSNVNNSAAIGLGKLNLPAIPDGCKGANKSCGLVYDGATQRYAWEIMERDTANSTDVAPTAGAVDAGLTPNS